MWILYKSDLRISSGEKHLGSLLEFNTFKIEKRQYLAHY